MTIGQMVSAYCYKNGITEREFADKVNMTEISVSRLIRDARLPAIPYLKNIANVLGMSFMELIHEHYSTWNSDDEVSK